MRVISLELVNLYQQMYEHTKDECAHCVIPHSCCAKEYCTMADQLAKEQNVTLTPTGHPKLPFMGEKGCIVPPHFRPLCTVHTCDVNSWGFKQKDTTGWTEKYFDIREQIDEAEYAASI